MEEKNYTFERQPSKSDDLSKFTESYASFNRIINSLQRKYIELKEEFSAQNEELVEANRKLVELSDRNILATEFLNGILNSISAGVIAVDTSGVITHFNPAASRILGIPQNEPVGKHYRDIIPPGDSQNKNAYRTVESGNEINTEEKTIEFADKSKIRLSVSTAIIKSNANMPVGAVEVFHDLTKIKKMEFELARLNTLAALGEMAATIAHEVRNPIAGIGGFAALLNRDMDSDDPKKALVEKISTGVSNLNLTIDTLLNYTRFEEINKEDIDYHSFIADTIAQFKSDHREQIKQVKFDISDIQKASAEGIMVHIDRMLYRQIFFNLFKNAMEAFDNKGTISIEIEKMSKQKAHQLYSDKLLLGVDETVVVTKVKDSGKGIKKEHLEKIFSPFFTTKSNGNGLGLAVAWKIVKTHGGDLFVENNSKESGAVFTMLLATRIIEKQGV